MNHRPSTIFHHRSAFTLIELLVVVAIIALLAAILLPALTNARAKAKSMACLSNLHQIAVATTMYGGDYKGYVPGPGGASWLRDYQCNAWSIATIFNTWDGPIGAGQLYVLGYIQNGQVFYCPGRTAGERVSATWSGGGVAPWSNFGKGGWIETAYYLASSSTSTNEGLSYGPWHQFGTTDPSKPLAFDFCVMTTDPATGFATWAPWGASKHRHGPGYNFVYFGGSGEFVKDTANRLETAYNTYDDMPWVYSDANFIYYIHTKFFGWTDHTRR